MNKIILVQSLAPEESKTIVSPLCPEYKNKLLSKLNESQIRRVSEDNALVLGLGGQTTASSSLSMRRSMSSLTIAGFGRRSTMSTNTVIQDLAGSREEDEEEDN